MNSKNITSAILAMVLMSTAAALHAQEQKVRLRSLVIFEGPIATPPGIRASQRVSVRQWIIDGGQKIAKFPHEGDLIVELKAGDLTTVIGGARTERREGEIWLVPAGQSMALETEDDSAVIKTTEISRL